MPLLLACVEWRQCSKAEQVFLVALFLGNLWLNSICLAWKCLLMGVCCYSKWNVFVCVAPTNGMQRKHVFDRPCLSMKPLFLAFMMLWAHVLPALAALQTSFTSANGSGKPCCAYHPKDKRGVGGEYGKGKCHLRIEQLKCGFDTYLLVQHGRIVLA